MPLPAGFPPPPKPPPASALSDTTTLTNHLNAVHEWQRKLLAALS